MNADLLRRIGEGLYGPNWHAALALNLRVSRRALQRWAAGDARDAPPTLRRDLARLVAARQDMLGALYREISIARSASRAPQPAPQDRETKNPARSAPKSARVSATFGQRR